MPRKFVRLLGALCLLVGCGRVAPSLVDWSEQSAGALRAQLRGGEFNIADQWLPAAPGLSRFYLQRGDRLAWSGPSGPSAQADALHRTVRRASDDGLISASYRVGAIGQRLLQWRSACCNGAAPALRDLIELDLLLSNAFLLYGSHLLNGRIDPRTVHDFWDAPHIQGGLVDLLQTALDLQQVGDALEELRPPQRGYERLKQVLLRYRAIAEQGGWPIVGLQGEGVRARLEMSGDWLPGATRRDALLRFQMRRHLAQNGLLDEETLAALNRPIAEQIAQIEINMERWRWLPHDADARYLLVRLDDYAVDIVSNGQPVHTMRAIVGSEYWRTPIFSAQMTEVVVNPYWYVPRSIAVAEILPMLQRDPTYAERSGMLLSTGEGIQMRSVDPLGVDWSQISAANFAYHFTQIPGGANPLGKFKFFFANPYSIYAHDTPNQQLFEREIREFSHGCIRVEDSLVLAAMVLDGWGETNLEALVNRGENRRIALAEPLPVFVLYWTAWVDEENLLHLRDDAYQSDAALRSALRQIRF